MLYDNDQLPCTYILAYILAYIFVVWIDVKHLRLAYIYILHVGGGSPDYSRVKAHSEDVPCRTTHISHEWTHPPCCTTYGQPHSCMAEETSEQIAQQRHAPYDMHTYIRGGTYEGAHTHPLALPHPPLRRASCGHSTIMFIYTKVHIYITAASSNRNRR